MPSPARANRTDADATRESILSASIRLFSERGFSGTSLRAIAEHADVNLAAANYHFGSKKKLLHAAFGRAVEPINAERIARLDRLQRSEGSPTTADIVRAFIAPAVELGHDSKLPQLLARVFAEPTDLSRPLIEETFQPVVRKFIELLQITLPALDRTELHWRVHYLIGAMLQHVRFPTPPFMATEPVTGDAARNLEALVRFAVAGLEQNPRPNGYSANKAEPE